MTDQLLRPCILLLLTLAMVAVFAACGPGDCGSLCDGDFWLSASVSDVRAQLDSGADVNGRNLEGWAPLPLAVIYDASPAIIELLIDQGADVNAKGLQDQTPLLWAVMDAQPGTNSATNVRVLLNKSADVSVKMEPSGITPLHLAISQQLDMSTIALMLDKGADVMARTDVGATPLHFAAFNSAPSVIQLLLDKGADLYAHNNYGETPCQNAIQSGRHLGVGNLLCRQ